MTSSTFQRVRRIALTATVAGACALAAAAVHAQGAAPIVVLLDKDAIAPNPEVGLSDIAVNATIAAVGVRDFLPAFTGRVGQHVTVPGGHVGSEGWFALTSAPVTWATTADGSDGLANFVLAGAGLGSPDENGDRQTWLNAVEGVQPLQAAGLQMLVGQSVCAVVFANDIPWTQTTTSLAGPTLGLMAFAVVGVSGGDGTTLPSVETQVLDPATCSGAVAFFANAPATP